MVSSSVLIFFVILGCSVDVSLSSDAALETVSKHGQLSVDGVNLVNQKGEKVLLKGVSLFWDIWMPYYYNQQSVDGAHELCHSNVVRAAVSIDTPDGGYLNDSEASLERLYSAIDAAIIDDIYVIVDWHEVDANTHLDEAREFFDIISKKYGTYPNIIYETYNEPAGLTWTDLKPYHEELIKTIRANDPDNVIVLGTPNWSQNVDHAAADPITGYDNLMYTLHFYAGTHKQYLRDIGDAALSQGLPIFVTEYGTVNADGDGDIDYDETNLWYDWLAENNISHVNWVIGDKNETSCILVWETKASQVCQEEYLTESGKLIVEHNKS